MESFVDSISCCNPIPLHELLEQSNDQKMQSLGELTTLCLKSFSNKCVWGMKRCWNCRHLHLMGLSESDFYGFICSLPTICEAWILQHGPECLLETLVIEKCVICKESYDALVYCFSNPCVAKMQSFTLKPDEKGNTRIDEKTWNNLCTRWKQGACPALESVAIPGNHIKAKGVEALMEVFQSGSVKKWSSLDMSDNNIGDKGLIGLSRLFDNSELSASIESLRLSHNGFHAKGFNTFVTHLGAVVRPQLSYLDLSYNSLNSDAMQSLFNTMEMNRFPALQTLNLSGITLKGAAGLAFASCIRANVFSKIQELYLNACSINKEGMEHICCAILDCPLQLLSSLSLSKNRLDSSSIQYLSKVLQKQYMPSLEVLNLSDNRIRDEGIQTFTNQYEADVLVQVKTLNLANNGIESEGAFVIFDCIRQRRWKSICYLNLEGNKLSTMVITQLRSLLEMDNHLETIRITDMPRNRASIPFYRRQALMPSKLITREEKMLVKEEAVQQSVPSPIA